MPTFLIERDFNATSEENKAQLRERCKFACDVSKSHFDSKVNWLESFILQDKIFCIYVGPDEDTVRKHSEIVGAPITNIYPIESHLDPRTAGVEKDAEGLAKSELHGF